MCYFIVFSVMDKEVLEVALKRFAKNCNLQRIIEVNKEPAVPKGENYSSMISRIKMKIVLGNGRTATRTVIVKEVKPSELSENLENKHNYLRAEAKVSDLNIV